MKQTVKKLTAILLLCAILGGLVLAMTGCGTVADDSRNVSSRPWNAPKTWEGPLPSTINEGR